ncbi:MAG: cytochrome c oxidase subunit [Bryobacterales bacterium]|jgi:cytochrome c oxidase subunit 2|nr:cytochrome c oxidase subunit [Bryobacterales bacterium]
MAPAILSLLQIGLLQAALLQGTAAKSGERRITNIFEPFATPAAAERDIGLFVMLITAAIFVAVCALLISTMIRFRRKPEDDERQEPPQVYGSNQIEIAWTFIPLLIIFVLIGVTARVIAVVQGANPGPAPVRARIIGHQWWFEVQFPELGVATANEIHVPVAGSSGPATMFQLESVDVIHSFWVPQLAGKLDMVPNRANTLWIDPTEPGTYLGNCAEYCGTQHANMLLRVTVEPKDEFLAWAAAQKASINVNTQDVEGRQVFESLSCVNCHAVRGTPANGKFGPDLTHVGSRQTIASGMIPNTPQNLRAWVNDAQEMKPGVLMPNMKLTKQELDSVVSYLVSLK